MLGDGHGVSALGALHQGCAEVVFESGDLGGEHGLA